MRPTVVDVYLNGVKKCTEFRADRKLWRNVQVYASDPWWAPALAAMGNFMIKST